MFRTEPTLNLFSCVQYIVCNFEAAGCTDANDYMLVMWCALCFIHDNNC